MVPEKPAVAPSGKYSPTQAARLLAVSRSTIYRAMDSYELPFVLSNYNNKRYIKGQSILKYYLTH